MPAPIGAAAAASAYRTASGPAPAGEGLQRYALAVEYDGSAFSGWQRLSPHGEPERTPLPTVQATLENALSFVAGRPVETVCAGRTDAGVHARGQVVHLDLDELPMLRTPCVLHWDMNHFVVLKSIGRGGAVVHDPAVGVRRLSLAQLSRHFTGVALELVPTTSFQAATAAPALEQ